MCKTACSQKQNNTFQRVFLRTFRECCTQNNCLVRRVYGDGYKRRWTQKQSHSAITSFLSNSRENAAQHFVNVPLTHYHSPFYPQTEITLQDKGLLHLKLSFTCAGQLLTACMWLEPQTTWWQQKRLFSQISNAAPDFVLWDQKSDVMIGFIRLLILNLKLKLPLVWAGEKMNKIHTSITNSPFSLCTLLVRITRRSTPGRLSEKLWVG